MKTPTTVFYVLQFSGLNILLRYKRYQRRSVFRTPPNIQDGTFCEIFPNIFARQYLISFTITYFRFLNYAKIQSSANKNFSKRKKFTEKPLRQSLIIKKRFLVHYAKSFRIASIKNKYHEQLLLKFQTGATLNVVLPSIFFFLFLI